MKIALVYDRVNKWGGAERTLLALHEIFPEAPLYTSVYDESNAPWAKVFPKIYTTFLQKIPFAKNNHELLGFLMPIAFETFNFDEYDIVISVTSEAAKGIITKPQTKHICYCLTPTRYIWSGYDEYLNNPPSKLSWIPFYRLAAKPFLNYVRYWDKIASNRPDKYVAISNAVKDRVKKYYGKDSVIIHPPVDIEKFNNTERRKAFKKDYYLFVSRLIPYKKADLAVKVFNELGLPLVVIGRGSEKNKLVKLAKSNIKFVDYVSDEELAVYYSNAKALIFPGEEDFGIVMVEALASGTPVVAYASGGASDIVKDGVNGVLLDEQNILSFIKAIKSIDIKKFDSKKLIKYAYKFTKEKFQYNISEVITRYMGNY